MHRLGEITIQETREFGLVTAATHVWERPDDSVVLEETFTQPPLTCNLAEFTLDLVIARFYGKTSVPAPHDWLQPSVFPITVPDIQNRCRTFDLLADHKPKIEQ